MKPEYKPFTDVETDSLAKSHRDADTVIRLNYEGGSEVMKRSMSKTDSLRDLNTFFSKSDPARPGLESGLPREVSQRSLHSILSQQEMQ